MKWRMRIGIFVGVLALALAATAPARAFLHTRNAGDVVIGSVEGSIWQPVLRGVKVGAFDAGDVRLSLSAADLLVGRIAADASALYARNLTALVGLLIKDGGLSVDLEDEILKAAVVTDGGAVVHEGLRG